MEETQAVSNTIAGEDVTVKTENGEFPVDNSEINNWIKSDGEVTAESPSKSIVEIGIETKVYQVSNSQENRDVDNVVQETEIFDEVEETYNEEIEEDGEVKVITKTRLIKVKVEGHLKDEKEDETEDVIEDGLEEEFVEEIIDEDGEIKVVKKTKVVNVVKATDSKTQSLVSYVEEEEEYEEEEVDETGETKLVIKSRMVRTPKKQLPTEINLSVDEILKKSVKSEEELDVVDEYEGLSKRSAVEKKSDTSAKSESDGSTESIGDDDKDETLDDSEIKLVKKKKSHLEQDQDKGDSIEKFEEDDDKTSIISVRSEEQRIATEKAKIMQQFDILLRLRGDHIFLRRKNFSLNNKLVYYFKKQKMEYVFTETREDQDSENKFFKKLEKFFECNKEIMEEKLLINAEWESQKQVNEELSNAVKEAREKMFDEKREIGSKMIDFHTGRTILHDKAIEDLLGRQELLMKHLSECYLSQIKLKLKIEAKRKERQMENMGIDFNLMDYEKLASLKEYYMDKITERDVEINEVSEKLAAMDENISMVRDRLKRTEDELHNEQLRLQGISADLLVKRANLNQVKANRHRTEKNTAKIKQQSGLLAYPILLKDYEDKSHQLKELTSQLELLKQNYRNGTIKIRNLKENIKRRTALKYSSPLTGKFSTMSSSM